jgi:hypothetical protein
MYAAGAGYTWIVSSRNRLLTRSAAALAALPSPLAPERLEDLQVESQWQSHVG